jgi:hypothetical protein
MPDYSIWMVVAQEMGTRLGSVDGMYRRSRPIRSRRRIARI